MSYVFVSIWLASHICIRPRQHNAHARTHTHTHTSVAFLSPRRLMTLLWFKAVCLSLFCYFWLTGWSWHWLTMNDIDAKYFSNLSIYVKLWHVNPKAGMLTTPKPGSAPGRNPRCRRAGRLWPHCESFSERGRRKKAWKIFLKCDSNYSPIIPGDVSKQTSYMTHRQCTHLCNGIDYHGRFRGFYSMFSGRR